VRPSRRCADKESELAARRAARDVQACGRRVPESAPLRSGDAFATYRVRDGNGPDLGQGSVEIDVELVDDAVATRLRVEVLTVA